MTVVPTGSRAGMDPLQLRRLGASLRQIAFPLIVFLFALYAFQIALMPLV